jgi:hypothetical protein
MASPELAIVRGEPTGPIATNEPYGLPTGGKIAGAPATKELGSPLVRCEFTSPPAEDPFDPSTKDEPSSSPAGALTELFAKAFSLVEDDEILWITPWGTLWPLYKRLCLAGLTNDCSQGEIRSARTPC